MAEKKLRVLHAIDGLIEIKKNVNEHDAHELEINLEQLESTMVRHKKKMNGITGTVSLFLYSSHYKKMSKQWEYYLTTRDQLYERYYDLCHWNGPYRITNPNRRYSCPGWCGSDPLEFIVWRRHLTETEKPVRPLLAQTSEKEWAKYAWKTETLCIDCIVSHNLYCVVCAEVVDSSEDRTEYDGYCICGSCLAEKQGQYALASKYVGECLSCGKTHVPLRLVGKQLLCDSCCKL